jgi:hypothetical protein
MTYPTDRRGTHWSHRLVRAMAKTCLAQIIGPEPCWLITVVAHQEDAKKYSGAVTYYNEQLMPLCGFFSHDRLIRARRKAEKAGWLHYEPGGKGKAGLYWTLWPADCQVDDSPTDDSDICAREIEAQSKKSAREIEAHSSCAREIEAQPERNPSATANHSSLSLSLKERGTEKDIVSEWNRVAEQVSLPRVVKLTADRQRALKARLADGWWTSNWQAALAIIPATPFCTGDNPRGWRADFDWFLRPGSAVKLLEGSYQNGNHNGNGHSPKRPRVATAGYTWCGGPDDED